MLLFIYSLVILGFLFMKIGIFLLCSFFIGNPLNSSINPSISNFLELNPAFLKKRRITENSTINVLSIDGGGIRGIIPAILIENIESRVNAILQREELIGEQETLVTADIFDLIAGTSVGGMIALALATPNDQGQPPPAHNISERFTDLAYEIFPRQSAWYKNLTFIPSLFWTSKYPRGPIEEKLRDWFNDGILNSLVVPTVVPSVELSRSAPNTLKVFKSYSPHERFRTRDVARATSAAPSYFPMHTMREIQNEGENIEPHNYNLVDGGLALNDPSLLAYTEALGYRRPIILVSIGTGIRHEPNIAETPKDVPYIMRGEPTVRLLFDAQYSATDKIITALARNNDHIYENLEIYLPEHLLSMDKSENIPHIRAEISRLYHLEDGPLRIRLDYIANLLATNLIQRRQAPYDLAGENH